MQCKKIASTLSRVVGGESKSAIEFDSFRWVMGKTTGSNIEYMGDLTDLIKHAHLFLKQIEKDENTFLDKVAISIPTEAYYSSKDKDDGGIVKKMEEAIKENIPGISDVVVLPQGASALNYLIKNKKVSSKNGNILIMDGGFNTLNISVVDVENGKIIFTESIHDELGVYNLLEFFREELKDKYDEVNANAQMLKKVFLDEEIDAGFKTITVKTEKQRAIRAFIPKLISRVTRDIKKAKISFGQFVFVGGISYYIDAENLSTTKNFYLPEKEGEFLTVLGMRETVGEDFDVFDVGFGDTKYILKDEKDGKSK
jgi:hypothetical protein